MKKLRSSLLAKTLAVILLALLALACAASTIAAWWLENAGAYARGYDYAAEELVEPLAHDYAENAGLNYLENGMTDVYRDTNFRYALLDGQGGTLLTSNWQGEPAWEISRRVTVPHDVSIRVGDESYVDLEDDAFDDGEIIHDAPEVRVTPTPRPAEGAQVYVLTDYFTGESHRFTEQKEVEAWELEHSVLVQGYVLKSLPVQDGFSQRLETLNAVWGFRSVLPWIAAVSLLLGLLLFVFLMSAAGHRDETDAVTPNVIDRLPWDLLTLILGGGVLYLMYLIGSFFSYSMPSLVLSGCAFVLAGLLFLLWCMSTATRLKLGTLLQSCLIYKLLRWCWGVVKAVCRGLVSLLRKLPLLWKWLLGLGALALIDCIWRAAGDGNEGMMVLGWMLLWLVLALVTCYAVLAFRRLRLGAKAIAAGDESATVSTRRLVLDFKDHAEDLNHIRAGLSRAVDERMKSERFKTELITNVSHDIKTPLTSIVSYVDLLGKEEIENDKAKEYIEVLQRQSARLKKLIDDLMEASKASTGNLSVSLAPCELGVLLDQTAGEYAEKLEQAGLELVLEKPEEPVTVLADGRHLWRIFDNLMNNVCKYALPGTRVYLSLARRDGRAEVAFRNISRERLKLEGGALTERFVRGDSSRSTEGSGLGLAIAQSLAQLQGGDLSVTVDGDLFKAVLSLPRQGQ